MSFQGQKFEKEASSFFHGQKHIIPLLVSPLFLRERGLGQVDLAWFQGHYLYVAECKSGEAKLYWPQERRLKASLKFLSHLFATPSRLFLISGFAKSDHTAYPFKVKKIGELA